MPSWCGATASMTSPRPLSRPSGAARLRRCGPAVSGPRGRWPARPAPVAMAERTAPSTGAGVDSVMVLALAAAAAWLGAQLVSVVASGHPLGVGLVDGLRALARVPAAWRQPGEASPEPARSRLPGPAGYWSATVLVFAVGSAAAGGVWRLNRRRLCRRRRPLNHELRCRAISSADRPAPPVIARLRRGGAPLLGTSGTVPGSECARACRATFTTVMSHSEPTIARD